MPVGGVISASLAPIAYTHTHTYVKKHTQWPAASLIFPLSLQFQEFYEWKMSGDWFSKATVSHELTGLCWWVHDDEMLLKATEVTRPLLASRSRLCSVT